MHNGKEEVYRALAERLSRLPVGVVINETLMEILKRLFTEVEASVGGKFPLEPLAREKIAEITGIPERELKKILETMAEKGLVVDISRQDTVYYMLSPMVFGFFEYTFMRAGPLSNREMAELFEQYLKEDDVVEEIFGASTKMFRALVKEKLIPQLVQTEVLSYEKASAVIRSSGGGALSMCACRHKASHLGNICGAPVNDICATLGQPSRWLIRRGFAREAPVDELLRNLERSEELGLVLLADNVLDEPAFLCHCCGCCCGVLRNIKEKKISTVHPSNFIATVDPSLCLKCAACAGSCQICAVTMDDTTGLPVVNGETCIGCGICAGSCPGSAMTMQRRPELHTPPRSKMDQLASIALERNRLE